MAMKRCPVCGERYSDTYKRCPFCEEEAALRDGPGRRQKGGYRSSQKNPSMLSPILIVVIIALAGLLLWLLFGDAIGKNKQPAGSAASASQQSSVSAVKPSVSGAGSASSSQASSSGAASGGQTAAGLTYETAAALPNTLTLSTEDFSLFLVGETHTISVSGGSGSYQWFSEDEGVASVDASGKVTAVSRGNIHVVVTDGVGQGTCIVRVKVSESAAPSTTTPPAGNTGSSDTSGSSGGSGLKAGAATVVNGGNGVFVRSGPGTSYEALATIPNGANVQIVESAGDGWYKITFSDVGGVDSTGYMKGDYLANK